MRHSLTSATAMAVVGALALWGCKGGTGGGGAKAIPTSATPPVSAVIVSIVGSIGNGAFQPNPVRANTGDTVMFRNSDNALHHLVMADGSADLGDIAPGATSQGFTLRNANATVFRCTLHPTMIGSINGGLPDAPTECVDSAGYPC